MMGMDLASLMSSVFGLNDKPKMAIRLPLRSPRKPLHSLTALYGWVSFILSTVSRSLGL